MTGNVILLAEERSYASQLHDTHAAVHDRQLILGHQVFSCLLIVDTVTPVGSPCVRGVEQINGLFTEHFRHLFQSGRFLAAQKDRRVAVAQNCISRVLVNGLQLTLGLQDDGRRDFTGSDRRNELIELRDLADVRKLIQQASDVDRQAPSEMVISPVTQQVEQLRIHDACDEIERIIRVTDDDEQRGLPVSHQIQLQFIVAHQVSQLFDVKRCKPCATGNKDTFRCLAQDKKSRTF